MLARCYNLCLALAREHVIHTADALVHTQSGTVVGLVITVVYSGCVNCAQTLISDMFYLNPTVISATRCSVYGIQIAQSTTSEATLSATPRNSLWFGLPVSVPTGRPRVSGTNIVQQRVLHRYVALV